MGMLACYMEADAILLARMKQMNNEQILNQLEEMEGQEEREVCDIDEMWDGLHCLLTGHPASQAEEGNPLSEAVVGSTLLGSREEGDYVACVEPQRAAEIARALDEMDMEKLEKSFSVRRFAKLEIYPDIWVKEDAEDLLEELLAAFQELRYLYRVAARKGAGVVVSIF